MAAAAIAALLLTGSRSYDVRGLALFAAEPLQDLRSVDELKSLFNRDVGKVRLVLLLSPT